MANNVDPDQTAPLAAVWSGSILFAVGWLCWGLTSQSTIFQSCRDGATASWVINQYFRGEKCLAQGHNTAAVGFEPPTSRSGVRHSTIEPPRSPLFAETYLSKNLGSLRYYKHFLSGPCKTLTRWTEVYMSWSMTKPTKWPVCPAKTQRLFLPVRLKNVWILSYA